MITLRSTTAIIFKLKQYKAFLQQMPDSSAKMHSLDLVKQIKRKRHLPPWVQLFCFQLCPPHRAVFHRSSGGPAESTDVV